ncbi:MAG: glycoside hydrolase family 130 protein [Alphaproteobacteria bacterium]
MLRTTPFPIRLEADPSRVVIRPFRIAPDPKANDRTPTSRMLRIVEAVRQMDMRTCQAELALVNSDFEPRHWQTRQVFLERYDRVMAELEMHPNLREAQKELIGAYFCHEYSYAAAALMNPSIVPHFDQSGLQPGSVRFILSLRAVGEGHISSISFREGILSADGTMTLLPEPPFAVAANGVDPFTSQTATDVTVTRADAVSLSGTVIFPITNAQRNGLEDLRLVHFTDDDGRQSYFGTYTAYSGAAIACEMLRTEDFRSFDLRQMSGSASRSKGLALFPRSINGAYAMIGRQDNENIFYLESDDLLRWEGGAEIIKPVQPWELVQMGNCGSPIELDEGWLLLTHGVGAMRQYSIGAALLDKKDPRKVLGRLPRPLISPADESRAGYVPNVVYTCGALRNGADLFLPYGVADSSVAFCSVPIKALLAEMA